MRTWQTLSKSAREAEARLPLKWRLAVVSFGLLAILLTALGGLVSFTQERAMLGNEATSLRQQARLALGAYGPGASAPTTPPPPAGAFPPDAFQFVDNLVHQLTSVYTRATVLATDGTVIDSDTQDFSAPPQVAPPVEALRSALTSTQSDDVYALARADNGKRQLIVLLPLIDTHTQRTVAILQLSTPTQPIDASIASMRVILGVGILAALAIAAALTVPLVSAALRPLVAMERASRRIAEGALSLRLDVPPTQDEIGRLARAFNSMVAQLDAAFQRQKRFVADVSHEMRTPLTALGGGLEMLLLGADRGDPAATGRLLRGLYAEVERMRRLVEDLLTLARLDEGQTVVRPELMDVGPLLGEICEEAEQLARGQTLSCEVSANLPRVRVDGDRFRQILLAVLDNAVKYTPAGGSITLSAHRAEDNGIAIEVRDTGVGIPSDALPHVFERFYRVDQARGRESPRAGGSGLGLSIVKSLIEAQNGHIAIVSESGKGTTVTISLPGIATDVESAARLDSPQPDVTEAQSPIL